ncbi:hypothetical protein [Kitasatospora sp. NPDC057198]|uniref:hypothetical protein n=1 Tax=Kitasatospora sp. NPDC057198 TaxID=3346046 RepID=UPI003634782C
MTPHGAEPVRTGGPGGPPDGFHAYDDHDEPAPEPVFVDQSGLRGRLLRGMGWPVSLVGAVLAVAMGGSLVGMQADAPPLVVPAQPAQAPAVTTAPSPSATTAPSPSATGTAGHSTAPGAKSSTGSTKPSTSKPSTSKPSTSKSSSKPTTASHAPTPSGQSTAHS